MRLGLQYHSIEGLTSSMDTSSAKKGLLLVGVLGAKSLASFKGDNVSTWGLGVGGGVWFRGRLFLSHPCKSQEPG